MFFNTTGQCMKLSLQLLVGLAVKSLNFSLLQIRAYYRPPTKLREGNVFTRVCLFGGVERREGGEKLIQVDSYILIYHYV